jgi:hypothetical protein
MARRTHRFCGLTGCIPGRRSTGFSTEDGSCSTNECTGGGVVAAAVEAAEPGGVLPICAGAIGGPNSLLSDWLTADEHSVERFNNHCGFSDV